MKKRVTLYDIASELDISASTVSRVLNGSSLISDEKSSLILETADRMGYIRRTVKKQKNRAILNLHLFLPPSRESFVHLFYDVAQLLEGIEDGFGEVSINISTRVNDGDLSFLNKKKTGVIDGCIFAFTRIGSSLRKELENKGIPYIHLNRAVEPAYILYDNGRAMDRLVAALYARHGEKLNPCYLGFSPLKTVDEERWAGVQAACRKRKIALSEQDRIELESIDELDGAMDAISGGKYNGLIGFNDMLAIAFLQRAWKRGIAVPGDISLTGLDNSPVQLVMPAKINTVDFSVFHLGKEAGQWLYKKIIEKKDTPCRLILEGDYIEGETV